MDYTKRESKEAAREQFHGVWAAITTPFGPDGGLDTGGLRRLMRHLTGTLALDGVFCTGVMGEFWSLSSQERKRAVEVVVEEARGKCRVIAHTAHHSVPETVDLTRHAQEAGADFAILLNPYYPPVPDEAMIYRWFQEVCDAVDIGVWMFDTSFAGYGLSARLTAQIARLENVCGIKIVRDPAHYDEVRRLTGGSIVMSDPDEDRWLSLIQSGRQQVFMSSPQPYCYQTASWQPMREYTDLAFAGRFEEAVKVSASLDEVRPVSGSGSTGRGRRGGSSPSPTSRNGWACWACPQDPSARRSLA